MLRVYLAGPVRGTKGDLVPCTLDVAYNGLTYTGSDTIRIVK